MLETLLSALFGSLFGAVLNYFESRRKANEAESNKFKALSEAAQLDSVKDGKHVEDAMNTAGSTPPITDGASLRAALGLKVTAAVLCLCLLAGCTGRQITANEYRPVVKNPPPPAAVVNADQFTPREQELLNWSVPLYKRVKAYNIWAITSNEKYGYYVEVQDRKDADLPLEVK